MIDTRRARPRAALVAYSFAGGLFAVAGYFAFCAIADGPFPWALSVGYFAGIGAIALRAGQLYQGVNPVGEMNRQTAAVPPPADVVDRPVDKTCVACRRPGTRTEYVPAGVYTCVNWRECIPAFVDA